MLERSYHGLNIRIDEVTAIFVEEVENLLGLLLTALSHVVFPGVAEVHGSKAQGADPDTRVWSEHAVDTQRALWLWSGLEDRHFIETAVVVGMLW